MNKYMTIVNLNVDRNSTIEALKLLLMFGVVVLHTYGALGKAIEIGRGEVFDLQIMRSFFICAVDCFIMISGYFLCSTNRRNLCKVINLYSIAVLFALAANVVSAITHHNFRFSSLLSPLVVGNYFLLLYIAVYILSPYLNHIFDSISKHSFELLLITMTILFSLYPTFIEYLFCRDESLMGYSFVSLFDGDGHGYTLVNFVFMYSIGAYCRKYGMPFKRKMTSFAIYLLSSVTMALVMQLVEKVEMNYFSPVCIISALSLFNLFALMKPTKSKVVNYLSSTVFGIYIVHGLVLHSLSVIMPIECIVNQPLMPRIAGILLFVSIVFVVSILFAMILNLIVNVTIMPILSRIKILSFEIK